MEMDYQALKLALREVLAEEMGFGRGVMASRWEGGTLVLKPADPNMKSKEVPIEGFFRKITSVREKLRVLEQKLNNHKTLSHEDKAEFQKLITRAQGSLTTFNILFHDEDEQFVGSKD